MDMQSKRVILKSILSNLAKLVILVVEVFDVFNTLYYYVVYLRLNEYSLPAVCLFYEQHQAACETGKKKVC